MSHRFASSIAASALAFAAIALALLAFSSSAIAADPTFSIDAGTSGNGPTTIGKIENCVEVHKGDRFEMDIVVEDIDKMLAWLKENGAAPN